MARLQERGREPEPPGQVAASAAFDEIDSGNLRRRAGNLRKRPLALAAEYVQLGT